MIRISLAAIIVSAILIATISTSRPIISRIFWENIFPIFHNAINQQIKFARPADTCPNCLPMEVELESFVLPSSQTEKFENCFDFNLATVQSCLADPSVYTMKITPDEKPIEKGVSTKDCAPAQVESGKTSYVLKSSFKESNRYLNDSIVVVMFHGRGSSPWKMAGYCSGDYTNNSMRAWYEVGFEVHSIKISNIESTEELDGFATDLLVAANYLDFLATQKKKVILYGISYGDVIANSLIQSGRFNNVIGYVSVGGIWRSDLPEALIERKEMSELYYSGSLNDSSELMYIISASSYDWGRTSRKTKSRLLKRLSNSNFRLNLFHGMHESDPAAESTLMRSFLNES